MNRQVYNDKLFLQIQEEICRLMKNLKYQMD